LRFGVVLRIAILGFAALLLATFIWRWDRWVGGADVQETDDAYLQSDLTPLGAKVAGYVRAVPVRDFQRVQAGQLLVQIVDDDYRAAVAQAEANVAAAQAAIENNRSQRVLQETNVRAAEAVIAETQADATRYRLEAARQRALLATNIAGTRQNVEQAEANEARTNAQLAQNVAQLNAQRGQLDVLDTQLKQLIAAKEMQAASLDLARINLGYTRIVAPVSGMVGQRQVRPGQYVGIGTQVIALVPLPDVWVIANYKETQMTRMRVGQRVDISVDAFPDLRLKGHVESWSPASGSAFSLLPPDNATGNFTKVVQRIPVKITLDGGEANELLRPGMSVVTHVHVDGR
jgi:membrane fusion protein (multidrug efflux system)